MAGPKRYFFDVGDIVRMRYTERLHPNWNRTGVVIGRKMFGEPYRCPLYGVRHYTTDGTDSAELWWSRQQISLVEPLEALAYVATLPPRGGKGSR